MTETCRKDLLAWHDRHRRDLPWRGTGDAYAVLVSEFMLQQTRVAAALPYYERWMSRFPTAHDVAAATDEELLGLWQGLGYYRRCAQLRGSCKLMVREGTPRGRDDWAGLPGVGPYTAAALASIIDSEPVAAVDGNVVRVFARVEACDAVGTGLRKRATEWAQRHVSPDRPGDWNQAMMELGAKVCTPRNPKCDACPIRPCCQANGKNLTASLPCRPPKARPVEIDLHCVVPERDGRVGMVKETQGPWWIGMYVFPGSVVMPGERTPLPEVCQTVTKHRLRITSELVRVSGPVSDDFRWLDLDETESLPVPRPHRRILEHALLALAR